MADMMYIPPPRPSNAMDQMGQLLMMLALKKVDQNFRSKEIESEAARERAKTEESRRFQLQMGGYEPAQDIEGADIVTPGGAGYRRPTPPEAPAGYEYVKDVPGYGLKKVKEAPTLADLGYYSVGNRLYQHVGDGILKPFSPATVKHLRPTTDDAGNVLYPAVDAESGESMPKYDIKVPAGGKTARPEKPEKPTGELTENAVLQNISELAQYDQGKTARMYQRYQNLRQSGMDRAGALNQVQREAPELSKNVLDEATALQLLKEAGGDKARARELARKRGYDF